MASLYLYNIPSALGECYVRKLQTVNPHTMKVILLTLVLKEEGVKLSPRCISASKLARNKIPTGQGSNFSMVLSVTLPYGIGGQKSKMAAEIMQLHLYTHESNEILTAKTCFWGQATLVGILQDDWVCRKSNMAASNQKQLGKNAYLSLQT